ncbi:MAG: tyrosine-type recombinase/integrase [Fodinibius sp.]|nr:tyrosine-type recombinase/integrase [Fodinibius sp.]
MLELLYSTGIRLSELVGLNEADINTKLNQITVVGKGAKQRIVPFGSRSKTALDRHH